MGEERYWIMRRLVTTSIQPDAGGHPAHRSVYRLPHRPLLPGAPVDDLVARVTSEALTSGNLALFRDHWLPRDWGINAARLRAEAGLRADAFRPRPLPPR